MNANYYMIYYPEKFITGYNNYLKQNYDDPQLLNYNNASRAFVDNGDGTATIYNYHPNDETNKFEPDSSYENGTASLGNETVPEVFGYLETTTFFDENNMLSFRKSTTSTQFSGQLVSYAANASLQAQKFVFNGPIYDNAVFDNYITALNLSFSGSTLASAGITVYVGTVDGFRGNSPTLSDFGKINKNDAPASIKTPVTDLENYIG